MPTTHPSWAAGIGVNVIGPARAPAAALALIFCGCTVSTSYTRDGIPPRLVVSSAAESSPVHSIEVVLKSGETIGAFRVAVAKDWLVVEADDGIVGRLPFDEVAWVEIERDSGGLAVVSTFGVGSLTLGLILGIGLLFYSPPA